MFIDVLHLLHEHPVVTLSSHARMGEAQDGAESVHAEVALPAAALSAGGRSVLHTHAPISSRYGYSTPKSCHNDSNPGSTAESQATLARSR